MGIATKQMSENTNGDGIGMAEGSVEEQGRRQYILSHLKSSSSTFLLSVSLSTAPQSVFFLSGALTGGVDAIASLILLGTSEKSKVPPKTSTVPNQCAKVKGLRKYTIEKRSERNFRRVSTRVTVREVHSEVSRNTELMHTNLRDNRHEE